MGALDFMDRTQNAYSQVDRNNFNLPGYEQQQGRLGNYLGQVDDRQAPGIGAYERAQQSQFRGRQAQLAGMLMGRAQGQNLVSSQVLKQGADAAVAQQLALQASARPGNAAMAGLTAASNAGRITQGLAGQQALAGAQEAQMAAMGLGGVLAQGRGADEQLGMFNAGQQNQRQFGQAQMNQQQMALNDAARAGLLGQSLQAAGMQQQGGIAYENNLAGRYGATLGVPTQGEMAVGGITGLASLGMTGGVGGGGVPGAPRLSMAGGPPQFAPQYVQTPTDWWNRG